MSDDVCRHKSKSQVSSNLHDPRLWTTHIFDILVNTSCFDEDLSRLVTRRAFLVDLEAGADVSITTCLLYQSCFRTVTGKDGLCVSALVSVSVEATHFCPVQPSKNGQMDDQKTMPHCCRV